MGSTPNGSIFKNFHDDRDAKIEAAVGNINASLAKIPAGQRVNIILSKEQFGKVQIPLDMVAVEMIS
jgi:hypothetical protein